MSESIEKIGDIGIGSDYNSRQVAFIHYIIFNSFKCWKNRRANVSDGLPSNHNRASISGFNVWDSAFLRASHIGFGSIALYIQSLQSTKPNKDANRLSQGY